MDDFSYLKGKIKSMEGVTNKKGKESKRITCRFSGWIQFLTYIIIGKYIQLKQFMAMNHGWYPLRVGEGLKPSKCDAKRIKWIYS